MDKIIVRGARTHNLAAIDLELPRDQLIVITGSTAAPTGFATNIVGISSGLLIFLLFGALLFVALLSNAFMRPVMEKHYLPMGDTADGSG